MAVNAQALRDVLASFASGVTVVTTNTRDGAFMGFTATAFSALSMEPPLVLVCVAKERLGHEALTDASGFVVNVLARNQEGVALTFASPVADRFAGLSTREACFGVPALERCLATIECERHDMLDGGDHSIVVGRVLRCAREDREPLLYFDRRFGAIESTTDSLPVALESEWLAGSPW